MVAARCRAVQSATMARCVDKYNVFENTRCLAQSRTVFGAVNVKVVLEEKGHDGGAGAEASLMQSCVPDLVAFL